MFVRSCERGPDGWNLQLEEEGGGRTDLPAEMGKPGPRLVHKLVFSMPAGTPPDPVLVATRNFMREEFTLRHRCVLALHTNEPHAHVHVVLKEVSERGKRLLISNAAPRQWRDGFAGIGALSAWRRTRPRARSGVK
jgi:hypothetical protein